MEPANNPQKSQQAVQWDGDLTNASLSEEQLSYQRTREIYRKNLLHFADYAGDTPAPTQSIEEILSLMGNFAYRKDETLLSLAGEGLRRYLMKTGVYNSSPFPGAREAIHSQGYLIVEKLVELQTQHPELTSLSEIGAQLVASSPFGIVQPLRRCTFNDKTVQERLAAFTMLYRGALLAHKKGTVGRANYPAPEAYTHLDPLDIYHDFKHAVEEERLSPEKLIEREKRVLKEQLQNKWREIKEESFRASVLFGESPLEMLQNQLGLVLFRGPGAIVRAAFSRPEKQQELLACHKQLQYLVAKGLAFLEPMIDPVRR